MTDILCVSGVVSVDENADYNECPSQAGTEILSMVMLAEQAGLSTGVVTTTRITHATPASAYAHSASRLWENDADLPEGSKCKDIGIYSYK